MPLPFAIPLAMAGLGAVSKGVGAVGSYFDQRRAQRQLDALGRQALPQYAVNPAVARIYAGAQREVASPEGFTGAERNAFMQNIASGLNTQAANARAIGGGSMSRAISGVLSGNQLGQYNQFAAQNAALARQNRNAAYSRLMGAANTMQGISNQNTSMLANRRLRQEELLGQAIASQRAYRTNLLNSLGSDLTTAGTYGLMGGMGETGSTNTGDGSNFASDLLFSPSQANTSLKYGGLNNAINRDLLANRSRMRGLGAYNNQFQGSIAPTAPSNFNPFVGSPYDAMDALDNGTLSTGFYRQ